MIGAGIFSPLIEIPCTIQCELIWHQMFVVFFYLSSVLLRYLSVLHHAAGSAVPSEANAT